MNRACESCAFYFGNDDFGSCRRYPPVATTQKEYGSYGDYEGEYRPTFSTPKVSATYWCGEYFVNSMDDWHA